MDRLAAVAGRVVASIVATLTMGVLLAAVLVPRLGGATPYAVLTSSMEPDLPPGTLVVVRPVERGDIAVGSVITYQRESGRSATVTHRVVATSYGMNGELWLTTKGDTNSQADPTPVRSVQVRGELWYAIPYLGHAHQWLNSKHQRSVVLVVGLLLVGYAVFETGVAIRQRLRARSRAESPGDGVRAAGSAVTAKHRVSELVSRG